MYTINDLEKIKSLNHSVENLCLYSSFLEILHKEPNCISYISLKEGEHVFQENDLYDDLYFLVEGTAEGYHSVGPNNAPIKINHYTSGTFLGEIDFIDEIPRIGSIVALTPIILIKLSSQIKSKNPILSKELITELMPLYGIKIRKVHKQYVQEMQSKILAYQHKNKMTKAFLGVTFVLSITLITNKIIDKIFLIDINSKSFMWTYMILLFFPIFGMLFSRKTLYQKIFLNSTPKGLLYSTIAGLTIMVFSAMIYSIINKQALGGVLLSYFIWITATHSILYFFHSYIQEMVRCFIQDLALELFSSHKVFASILLPSYVFGLMHIHFGLIPAGMMFVSGIGLSIFYLFHKSITYNAIFHWLCGSILFSLHLI